jgi:hypothetical protein
MTNPGWAVKRRWTVRGLSFAFRTLVLGAAAFFGTTLVGQVLAARMHVTLIAIPLVLGPRWNRPAAWGQSAWRVGGLLAVWRLVSAAGPVP